MERIKQILKYFPQSIYNLILEQINLNQNLLSNLQEIRIRANRPIILRQRYADIIIDYNVSNNEILQTLERICENSIYAYKNQICEGFLTIQGGHRIGITGSVVIENNQIINIKYISSLNFRIAREVMNCSNGILNEILDIENHTIFNTLIVAPPGKGKTTFLRDAVRQISNGIVEKNFRGKTVGLIDERGEIAATYKGVPQNDVGIRTDVIGNISKYKGIQMLIRSMAPEIIACDEIGTTEDVKAIEWAMISGVKGIFTLHGRTLEDVKNNKEVYKLVENKYIEKIVFI